MDAGFHQELKLTINKEISLEVIKKKKEKRNQEKFSPRGKICGGMPGTLEEVVGVFSVYCCFSFVDNHIESSSCLGWNIVVCSLFVVKVVIMVKYFWLSC